MEYLDFELPLKELEDQLEKCNEIRNESKVDVKDTYKNLKAKIEQKKKISIQILPHGKGYNYLDTLQDLIR